MKRFVLGILILVVAGGCQTGSGGSAVYVPPTPRSTPAPKPRTTHSSKPSALEQRLSSRDPAERIGAAVVLLARSDRKSKQLVQRTLTDSGSELAKAALIEALRIGAKPEYAEQVVAALSSPSRLCREAATGTLAVYDSSVVGDLLLVRLKAPEPDADTRRRVIVALGAVGEQRAVEPLLELLTRPELTDVASQALTDITGEDIKRPEQWQDWWRQNRSPNQMEWFRRELATQKDTIAELRAELEIERKRRDLTGEQVAEFLLEALRQRDPAKETQILINALQMPYEKVKLFAAGELGRLKSVEAVQTLSSVALVDAQPTVRAAAVNALAQIDADKVVPTLGKALQDTDPVVASAAAAGLGKAEARSALRPLLMALLHNSPRLRSASAEALGRIGDTRAVRPLLKVLASDDVIEVRQQAAKALGTLKDKRAVSQLVRALDAPEASLRVFAVDALGDIGDTSVVARLCRMLTSNENPGVRESSAVALGKLRDPAALSALRSVLTDKDEKLQELAFGAIIDICRTDVELHYRTADELLTEKDYTRAEQLFVPLLEAVVDKPDLARMLEPVRKRLSRCYLAQKQWSKAVELLEELNRADAKDVTVIEPYARALAGAEKWPEAFRQYTQLTQLTRKEKLDFWPERLMLLDTMMEHKRHEQVVELIDEVMKNDTEIPKDVVAKLQFLRRTSREKIDASVKNNAETTGKFVRALGSENEADRNKALQKLREISTRATPALVVGLADENPKVRRGCFELLRQVAGESFDYDPDAPTEVRDKSLERWRAWLKTTTAPTTPIE